jgi:hypothetical protein
MRNTKVRSIRFLSKKIICEKDWNNWREEAGFLILDPGLLILECDASAMNRLACHSLSEGEG